MRACAYNQRAARLVGIRPTHGAALFRPERRSGSRGRHPHRPLTLGVYDMGTMLGLKVFGRHPGDWGAAWGRPGRSC